MQRNEATTSTHEEEYHTTPLQNYKLSKEDFVKGAQQLSEILANYTTIQRSNHGSISTSSLFLHAWELRVDSYGDTYLQHPPVVQRLHTKNIVKDDDINEEWIEFEDDSIQIKDPDIIKTLPIEDDFSCEDFELNLTVVYSHVWAMPVLYFQVYKNDGKFLSREEVLKVLNLTTSKEENDSMDGRRTKKDDEQWNFVSQEEHPITGRPAYFFHPCQTSSRMQLVFPDKDIMTSNPCKWISTWLSLILPAAGFRISPQLSKDL